jgi:Kef-type K+ transport system membrane component KefB
MSSDKEFILISDDGKALFSNFTDVFLKFGLLALLLTINFTAVSIALMSNKNESFGVKIFAVLYSFLFGIIYILVNYYSYRVLLKKSPVTYEGEVYPW